MNAYEFLSSDLAARLGLKRATLDVLAVSLTTNCLLAGAVLFKTNPVTTVLVPVGLNEVTHPLTVSDARVDQEYLMLVARDILSLALNNTPENVDHNRHLLLKHVAPSAFGVIDEELQRQAQKIKELRASTFFSVENVQVDAHRLTVTADGVRQHFIGKTETLREKTAITLRFNLVAGRLQLASLSESDPREHSRSAKKSQ